MGFHLNVHPRMTLVNARGGGEWGSFRFWESFKSVKCNDTSKDIYRNQIDKSKVFLAAIMDPMNKPMTDPMIKTMRD